MTFLESLNMTGSVSVAAMNANPQVMEEHNWIHSESFLMADKDKIECSFALYIQ